MLTQADNLNPNKAPWREDSPGGGGYTYQYHPQTSSSYGSVEDKFLSVLFLKGIGNVAESIYDVYMQGYNMQHEAMKLEATLIIDMFDTPEDIERSIDIIEATVGFELAVYEIAVVCITNPTVGAVIVAVGGAIWGARALYKACN